MYILYKFLMEITALTFNIKDVITIVFGIASLLGVYYSIVKKVEKQKSQIDDLKAKQLTDHTALNEHLKDYKVEVGKRIDEIRDEQKAAHNKLEAKMDAMSDNISAISSSLSELTGYIKAKK